MGFIKDATGSFSLALAPLVALGSNGRVGHRLDRRRKDASRAAAGHAAGTPA